MQRRTFLLTSLLPALLASAAESSEIDPKQTFVLQRDGIRFAPWAGLPPGSGEMAKLYGDIDRPGPYLVLMKWNAGWFSAPHSYATDRIQMVGQQWRRLHAGYGGAGAGRRLCQANRTDLPL